MSRKRVPADVRLRIRAMAGDRCGYCLSPQRLLPWELEIGPQFAAAVMKKRISGFPVGRAIASKAHRRMPTILQQIAQPFFSIRVVKNGHGISSGVRMVLKSSGGLLVGELPWLR